MNQLTAFRLRISLGRFDMAATYEGQTQPQQRALAHIV